MGVGHGSLEKARKEDLGAVAELGSQIGDDQELDPSREGSWPELRAVLRVSGGLLGLRHPLGVQRGSHEALEKADVVDRAAR